MDCYRALKIVGKCLLAALVLSICDGTALQAKPSQKLVYNPMTQQVQREVRTRRAGTQQSEARKSSSKRSDDSGEEETEFDSLVEQATYESDPYYDNCQPDCGYEEPCIGCGDPCCGDCVGRCRTLNACVYAGIEATYIKPRFEDNVAFTVMESNGASAESFTDAEFDYDLEFAPRVYVGWQRTDGLGMRITWWQFDHSAADVSDSPPANGFGEITHPPFGDVDISSNVPTNVFSAASDLNAYTIDLEATKQVNFSSWHFGVGGGVRYALAEQQYLAQLRATGNVLRGRINFRHSIEGIGPTISVNAYRPWTPQLSTFCQARGSMLFGDGESLLNAGEDLDLANSFSTTRTTSRDDLLSIAEVQVGLRWQAERTRKRLLIPFVTAALEGQIWNGAGNATSEEGDLGFFGFTSGFGVDW